MFAVGRHAVQDERARAGDGMDQIGLAVVVPEWTGIFKAGLRDDDGGIAPRTGDAGRGRDEDALIRGGEVDVKKPVVLPDGGRPHAFAVAIAAHHAVARVHGEAIDDVTNDGPMDEIRGLQNGNPGNEMEGGGDEIVVSAVADHIGIGVVGEENGVVVDALCRRPGCLRQGRDGERQKADRQQPSD